MSLEFQIGGSGRTLPVAVLRGGLAMLAALACAACGPAEKAPAEPSAASVERIVAEQDSNLAADGETALRAADARAKARAKSDIEGMDAAEADRVKERP